MTEIVKVQVAIDDRDVPALVYARDRRDVRLQWLDEATLEALGNDHKGYFEGELGLSRWFLGKRVAEQSW